MEESNNQLSQSIALKKKPLLIHAVAEMAIEHGERLELSARDSLCVIKMLGESLSPSKKLIAAAHALQKKA